jgi:hypothetical protein
MPCQIATDIDRALRAAEAQFPQVAASELLDLAMEGREGTSPDFSDPQCAWGSLIDPREPLGRAVLQRFGSMVDMRHAPARAGFPGDAALSGAGLAFWQAVLEAFGEHYMLWLEPAELKRIKWLRACANELIRLHDLMPDDSLRLSDNELGELAASLSEDSAMLALNPLEVARKHTDLGQIDPSTLAR